METRFSHFCKCDWAKYLHIYLIPCLLARLYSQLEKGFQKNQYLRHTNSRVFILDFYITNPDFEERSSVARKTEQTIPDCIRYIIGVFCYNFKSQTNILASY